MMAQSKKLRKNLKYFLYVFIVILLALLSGFIEPDITPDQLPATPGYFRVTEVPDGDTIVISMDGRDERVRLIGVDTPETIKPNSPVECYGQEASNYLKNLLQNQEVKIVADPINQNRDRYDRLLRYVYFKDQLVNKQIIEQGYGFAYLSFPFTKSEEFRLAQVQARQNNVGVWAGQCDIKDPDGERPKTNQLTNP